MTTLRYKVFCKRDRPYFELIAAFDCEQAAVGYAGECALTNPTLRYEARNGRVVLKAFGP